jgi:hypothetical protein
MRSTLPLALLLALASPVRADGPAPPAAATTDATIIGLCGDSLANLFAKCGPPADIFVNDDKLPILTYGAYGFRVENKVVTGSYFFKAWTGSFNGINRGDTKDQAIKVLGGTYKEIKGKDFDAFGWTLPAKKAVFWLYFTKDGKVDYPQVVLDK